MLTLRQSKYHAFWSLVQRQFVRAGCDVSFGSNPHANWVSTWLVPPGVAPSSHLSKSHLAYAFDKTGQLKCEINLQSGYVFNKFVFDFLSSHKISIDTEFGDGLVWRRADDKDRSQIKVYFAGSSIDDNGSWDIYTCWLFMNSAKMRNVFSNRIIETEQQFKGVRQAKSPSAAVTSSTTKR